MVETHKHEFDQFMASMERPYHFVNSGLSNVYLIGVECRVCRICGKQAANIPAIEELMTVIARVVVRKDAALSGPEIRFLRKRLGIPSAEFGNIVGVTKEQVSRWENGHNGPEKSADKLIRVFYCLISRDPTLEQQVNQHIEDWLTTIPGADHISKYCAKLLDKEWTAESVLA